MVRLLLYIILTFIIFSLLKFILNFFRKNNSAPKPTGKPAQNETEKLDKSKIVDADFEEIK